MISKTFSNYVKFLKKFGLCPSILNLYVKRYSFSFFLNDIISGIKIFLCLFPIVFSLAVFCGCSPIQGVISTAIASAISIIFGGNKYNVTSISLPVCILTFEILVKYQYKGLFYTALFVAIIMIILGLLRISNILKSISYAFISAISIYTLISIIINQTQCILGINTLNSSQSLFENIELFRINIEHITIQNLITFALFTIPLILCKLFIKGGYAFFVYLVLGYVVVYCIDSGFIPEFINIKTIGQEMVTNPSAVDTMFSLSHAIPSQTFLSSCVNYAFVIALILSFETCFCSGVVEGLTGDSKIQHNCEVISTGLANLTAIACGGLFISPNLDFTVKNIYLKSKTIVPFLCLSALSSLFVYFNDSCLRFIPMLCIHVILLSFAVRSILFKSYDNLFDFKSYYSIAFWLTLVLCVFFGLHVASIVGFCFSLVLLAKRLVNIKDAKVHTTRNHDNDLKVFLYNKMYGLDINGKNTDRMEVIIVSDIISLHIAKITLTTIICDLKKIDKVVIYFQNVPFIDNDAFVHLQQIVKIARIYKICVIVSGSNGILLDVLRLKASRSNDPDSFGYIVPSFSDVLQNVLYPTTH